MSRTGQKPIKLPSGVTLTVKDSGVTVKGVRGELSIQVPSGLRVAVEKDVVRVTQEVETEGIGSLHGLTRSLVANMVAGVSQGFSKDLEIQGVGFKAAVQGQKLVLSLGFSSPVEYTVPDGVKVVVDGSTKLSVSGPDKHKVGDTAARIRSFFPVEPYKGKGIRFKDEHVRKKVGKTVA